jgi:hypothetical protein
MVTVGSVGVLDVAGTYNALNNIAYTVQGIVGTGTVTLGTLNVEATANNTSFAIGAGNVTADVVEIVGYTSVTTKLTVDGTLTVNDAFTVIGVGATDVIEIDSTGTGTIVWKEGCVVQETAAPTTPTYHALPVTSAATTVSGSDESHTYGTDWVS